MEAQEPWSIFRKRPLLQVLSIRSLYLLRIHYDQGIPPEQSSENEFIYFLAVSRTYNITERKQRRPRRHSKWQESNRLDWQINKARILHHEFGHFFAVAARLRPETSYLDVLWRTWTPDNIFFFFSWTSIWSFRTQLQKKSLLFVELNEMDLI